MDIQVIPFTAAKFLVSLAIKEYIRTNTTPGGINSYPKPVELVNLRKRVEK